MPIKEYKCPNCAGAVTFDISIQKMKCGHCDTVFELAATEQYLKAFDGAAKDTFEWVAQGSGETLDTSEGADFSSGACPSCGAGFYGDKNTIAVVCPCCGNAQIVPKLIRGVLKPDYLIPFKCGRKAAGKALERFCKGKKLLPDSFAAENRVRSLQGIYVPFWLFEAKVRGQVCYSGIKFRGRGDNAVSEHYIVVRDGSVAFDKIPADGSKKMDDDYMDAIEPFYYSEMVPFHPSYLAGYLAEKYDVDAERCKKRVEARVKAAIEEEFKKSAAEYASLKVMGSVITVSGGKISYALLPVWALNTKYKGKNYAFMINGQNSRLAGKLPIDEDKAWKYKAALTGAFGALFTPLAYLCEFLHIPELLITFIIAILSHKIDPRSFDIPLYAQIIAAWCGAAAWGWHIVNKWEKEMDTTVRKGYAKGYMVSGSVEYKTMTDTFLFSK